MRVITCSPGEQQHEFFKAMDDYQQITTPAFQAGIALAIERCEKAALYVRPDDRQLMQPGVLYCYETIYGFEFFDLDSYKRQESVRSMRGWTLVAQTHHQEGHERHYQKRR